MSIRTVGFSRLVLLCGLAFWTSIAALNNLTDSETNSIFMDNMLSMRLLKADPVLGLGLRWRAWSVEWAAVIVYAVAAYQVVVSVLLWRATLAYAHAWLRCDRALFNIARNRAVLALTCFLALWFGFIGGGLWFGYWMKQGAIQSVHMTLILIALASLLLVEAEPGPSAVSKES